jgi:excisionase family DNA binding protein
MIGVTLAQLDPQVNTPEDLISVDDAVEEYGLSRSTIFRLVKSGLVRFRRVGDKKSYISRSQLEEMTSFRKA